MNALNYFLSDLVVILFPLGIIIFALIWSAKSSFKRHDLIVEYVKKNGWVLIEKDWYSAQHNNDTVSSDIYYDIKYLDKNKRLHKARVKADDWTNKVHICSDTLLD